MYRSDQHYPLRILDAKKLTIKDHHPPTLKPVCQNQIPATLHHYSNPSKPTCRKMIPCGSLYCKACRHVWCAQKRGIISYGANILQDSQGYFVTLTIQGSKNMLNRLMDAYRQFRKNVLNRYYKGSYYVTMLEFGTKSTKRPHLHLLIYPLSDLPTCGKRSLYYRVYMAKNPLSGCFTDAKTNNWFWSWTCLSYTKTPSWLRWCCLLCW